VTIRSISRNEFDAFQPFRAPETELRLTETEWFADDGGSVIGLIAEDSADKDWLVAVLARDQHGTFRAVDVESCIELQSEARDELLSRMEKAIHRDRLASVRITPRRNWQRLAALIILVLFIVFLALRRGRLW
jgi:hypothetical protein